jgi:RNA polymerase II subunit A C-terminal domain phosphatase SSU72
VSEKEHRYKIIRNNFTINFIFFHQIDNPEDATLGAFLLLDLATKLEEAEDLDDEIDEIVHDFETKCDRSVLHTVVFY